LVEGIKSIVAQEIPLEEIVEGEYYPSLRKLARLADPRGVILELGVGRGGSGIHMCLGAAEGSGCAVYGVDNFTMKGTSPSILLAGFQIHRVRERVLMMSTAEAAEIWGAPISLLFIDADHSYEACKQDFEMFYPFVIGNGIIVFHDSERESVKRVIEEKINLLHRCVEKMDKEGRGCFYALKKPV